MIWFKPEKIPDIYKKPRAMPERILVIPKDIPEEVPAVHVPEEFPAVDIPEGVPAVDIPGGVPAVDITQTVPDIPERM